MLRGGITLKSNADFYKLIAWSVVAGYSERFVMNKLDAFASGARTRAKDASQGVGPHDP